MVGERTAFITQMVEVLTSTVSFGERLNNMVHLLARHLRWTWRCISAWTRAGTP